MTSVSVNNKSSLGLLFAFLLGAALVLATGDRIGSFTQPSPLLLSPPENLPYFTLGYNESVADGLWLRVIQDLDICEKVGQLVTPVNGSFQKAEAVEGVKAPGVPIKAQPKQKCHKGWPFRMLLSTTEVAPKFIMPYLSGAIVLSVLGEDREGATILFNRGVERFPQDWGLLYRAAYHFMYEENQPSRAAQLLIDAGKAGAPYWVYSLAAKLMAKDGQMALAESVLKQQIDTARNEEEKVVFERRLEELRTQFRDSEKAGP